MVRKDGELKTRAMLSEEFEVNINFIGYIRLIRAIPQELIILANEFDEEVMGPWCQKHILTILGDNKCNQLVKKQFVLKKNRSSPRCM